MSLSQKHTGKVLVPWFNIAEWEHVYNLIYSATHQDWPKALKILQAWKHRTPLLSAGVEGTLIVLGALLVNRTQLSSYETSHIFSTSLVRFLNLCAANSDKQGTFYKTAMQNELPKWLINIRHDIAHSHKVPSESMLLLSLKYCIEWLKEKYWDVQSENISDFIIRHEGSQVVEDCIYTLQYLDDESSFNENTELMMCVMRTVKTTQKQRNRSKILDAITNILKEEITKNRIYNSTKILKLLIEDLVILSVTCDNTDGKQKIPSEFLQRWGILINVIHETQILPDFTWKLFDFVCDENNQFKYREVASLWIKEIFNGLIKKEKHSQDEVLHFTSTNDCMKTKEFANQVLLNLNQFTPIFLREVLEYNSAPPQFVEDSINLVSAFSTSAPADSSKIFQVEDLNFSPEDLDPSDFGSKLTVTSSKSRWKLIEDTTAYMNLPLGVLPHQSRFVNPLLEV